MKPSTLVNLIALAGAVALIALAGGYLGAPVNAAQATFAPTAVPKTTPVTLVPLTPTPISGGIWQDEFWDNSQFSAMNSVRPGGGHLMLKVVESLNWKQTWTAHFALGEFFRTRAISDSVQLAPMDGSGQYYTTGVYTSTVFDAGRTVDWLYASWTNLESAPRRVVVEFRSGNSLPPDDTWGQWSTGLGMPGGWCINDWVSLRRTDCMSNLPDIQSSRYFQYRAIFNSDDPGTTPALTDMNIAYGLYAMTGTANSRPIAPVDLRSWKQVFYTATVPLNTALTVDVFAPDGRLLLPSVSSGDSLASIAPSTYGSVQLRASFVTNDPAYTPDLDVWGLTWQIGGRLNFPIIGR